MPLACPSCRDELTLTELLEGAFSSVPGDSLVDFRCRRCGERGLARLLDGLAETRRATERGTVEVVSFEVVPELAVTPWARNLRVWYLGTHLDVPCRDGRITSAPKGHHHV